MSATHDLAEAGQSIWLDNITRDLLNDGSIQRCIDELAVTGLTSNPSIFEKAVAGSTAYDAQVAATDGDAEAIFFRLAIEDLRRAADLFANVHERTKGLDGWVSLEVSPLIADDATATVEAAIAIHEAADRPNLFIKIPGTPAGLEAIEEATFAGIPVNVTLLFSTQQYQAASDAYLKGLERRAAAGRDLAVVSVASLFISRWDVATASELPDHLKNKVGVAIGSESYASYRSMLASERFARLAADGAQPQRLLFASTGVKDPSVPDTFYVESLVAADTINTMPDATLKAFADHGSVNAVLPADGGDAVNDLAAIAAAGIDLEALATRLQEDGKDAFVASWNDLLGSIRTKAGRDA